MWLLNQRAVHSRHCFQETDLFVLSAERNKCSSKALAAALKATEKQLRYMLKNPRASQAVKQIRGKDWQQVQDSLQQAAANKAPVLACCSSSSSSSSTGSSSASAFYADVSSQLSAVVLGSIRKRPSMHCAPTS